MAALWVLPPTPRVVRGTLRGDPGANSTHRHTPKGNRAPPQSTRLAIRHGEQSLSSELQIARALACCKLRMRECGV